MADVEVTERGKLELASTLRLTVSCSKDSSVVETAATSEEMVVSLLFKT